MITVDIQPDIDELTDGLRGASAKVEVAIRRARRIMLTWLQRQLIKAASKVSGAKQKTFKDYQRITVRENETESVIWLGTNPLPLHEAGRVSWSRRAKGARVKGETYDGSFYRAVYGSKKKVWIRTSRNATEGHVKYNRLNKTRRRAALNSSRFPVELLGVEFDQEMESVDDQLERKAQARFRKALEQELNFALNHER